MNKQYKVLVNTGKTENNQTLTVTQGQGAKGQPLRIPAKAGVKYQLQEIDKNKEAAPEYVKVKRVGKHLHILLEGSNEADIIIEDYYEVMPEGYNGVIGQAENGNFYEYIPEDPDVKGLIPELADGGQAVNVALGGSEVVGSGAAVGILAFNPLLAGLGLLGAGAAAAAAAGTTTGTTLTVNPITSDNNLSTAERANATTPVTGTVSGNFTAGDTVTLTVNGKTYTGQVNANGTYSIDVPTADLVADSDKQIEASIAATGPSGNTTATATHTYTTNAEGNTDTAAPTIAVSADNLNLATGATTTVRFTLSEASTNFTADDVTVVGGKLSNFQGSGTSYTAIFTPAANATSAAIVVASDKFSDAAGNLNKDGADANNTVSLSIGSTTGATTLVVNAVTVDNNLDLTEQGNATTAVTGTVSGNFSAGNIVTLNINGKPFTGAVTANGTYSIDVPTTDLVTDSDKQIQASVAATGASGNTTASATHTYTLSTNPNADTTAPTIAVSADSLSLATGATTTVRFTLSEASTNFTADDVTVVGGTLSNFQGSGTSYTATFTPTAGATSAAIVVASDKFSDAAANLNKDGADTNNTVSLTIGNGNQIIGSTSLIINSVTADNILSAAEQGQPTINITGKVSGAFAVGNFSVNVTTADLLADRDSTIDGTVTGTGGTAASAVQNYGIDTTPVNPDPYDPDNIGAKTAITIAPVTGDNVLAANESGSINVTGLVSGAFAANDTVTLYVAGKTYTGKVLADGTYSIAVPAAELLADKDSKIEADVTGTGGDKATAQQDYIVETNPAAPTQTAISVDPVTADNVIAGAEKTGSINVTGTVSGKFAEGDKVTLSINGKTYTGLAAANGRYTIAVPAAELMADSDTTIDASVTGTGGTAASAMQNYVVDSGTAPAPTPSLKTALVIDPITGDNIITVTEGGVSQTTVTGTVSGTFKAGDIVSVVVNGKTFTGTAAADGKFSINVPTADLTADADSKIEGAVMGGNGGGLATAAQDYVVETPANAGKQTALSIDPVTADDVISAAEAALANTTITGKVTGAYAVGDTVTLTVNGKTFTGQVVAGGSYSVVVPTSDLLLDADTTIDGTVTGTGGTTAAAMQNYAVDNNVTPPVVPNGGQALGLTIDIDNNVTGGDGLISAAEKGSANSTSLTATFDPTKVAIGQTVTFTDGVTVKTVTLTAADVSAGKVTSNGWALPAEGATLNVKATLSDGTSTTPEATDSAKLDTTAPNNGNPLALTIDLDKDNSTIITGAEKGTQTTTSVTATFDKAKVAVGDIVTISDGTTTRNVALTADDIAAGKLVTTGWPLPADTKTLTVTATLKDAAGNTTPQATDSATLDLRIPVNPNDPGYADPYNPDNTGTKTAISLNPVTGDNLVTAAEGAANVTLTGTVSGAFATGDTVSLYVNGSKYTGQVNAQGQYAIVVKGSDVLADKDSKIEAEVTGTNGDKATALQDYVLDTRVDPTNPNTPVTVTALSIAPITGDNFISATDGSTALTNVTGQVSGAFAAGDTVTLSINGKPYTGTAAANGSFSIAVPTADLLADSDTTVTGTVTGTGGTAAVAMQNYALASDINPMPAPGPNPDPNVLPDTGSTTAISLKPITGDNVISPTEATGTVQVEGVVSGKFAAGDIVTVYVNGTAYTGTAAADGKFSIAVPAAQLVADKDTQIEAKVTGTGGDTATAAQNYVVETTPAAPTQTALSLDPITGDNYVSVTIPAADVTAFASANGVKIASASVTNAFGLSASDTEDVTIDLTAPVAVADTATGTEDATTVTGSAAANDTGKDGSETFAISGSATGAYGSLVVNADGSYTYTVDESKRGQLNALTANATETFNYSVTDAAGNTSSSTITVTLTPVNDAPVNTVPGAQTTAEDTAQAITGLAVTDVDAGNSPITVTLSVTNGALTAATNSGVTVAGNGSASVTLTGSVADINTLLALASGVSYTPTANYNGSDTLTMLTSDGGNTGSGGTLTDSDTVAITVTAGTDAPTGTDATLTLLEDATQVLTAANFGFADADGDTLASVRITSLPTAGTLTLNGTALSANATVSKADIDAGKLVFTPAANANGAAYATLQFAVIDSSASNNEDLSANTLTFSVSAVNDAPGLSTTTGTVTAEANTAVSVFSATAANTGPADENTQAIKALSLTVSGVADGSAEKLIIGGTEVALAAGTTTIGSWTATVTVTGTGASTVATVSLVHSTGVTPADLQAVIDGMQYKNTDTTPTDGNRVITLTSVQDTGGTANVGVDTATLNLASTVSVSGNIAPVAAVTEIANPLQALIAPELTITDNVSASNAGNSSNVTFTFKFSEGVTGFTADDVTLTAGTKGAFTQVSANEYTLVVATPTTGSGAIGVSVASGSYTSAGTGLAGQGAAASQWYGADPAPAGTDAFVTSSPYLSYASHYQVGDKVYLVERSNPVWYQNLGTLGAVTVVDANTGAILSTNVSSDTMTTGWGYVTAGVSPDSDSLGNFYITGSYNDRGETLNGPLTLTQVNAAGVPQTSRVFASITNVTTTANWVIDDNTIGVAFTSAGNGLRVMTVNPTTGAIVQGPTTVEPVGGTLYRPLEGMQLADGSYLLTLDLADDRYVKMLRFTGSSLTPVSFDVDTVYSTGNFHTTLLNDGKVALLSDGVATSGSGYAVYLTVVDPITQTVVNRFNYPEANVVPAGYTLAYNFPRDVVQLKDGGIVITGVAINSTTGKYGVYATIVNTDGTVKVPPFMVDEAASIFQDESISLLALDNGGFQVAYQDNVPNTSVSNLKTSTFDVSGNLVQTGTTAGATDTFTGGDKGDTFTANGGADIILAGGGNDTVVINGDNITKLSQSNTMLLDGGSGINTLKISDSGNTLDLTDATIAAKVQGFNTIDLTGTGNNTLKLDPAAVVRTATTDDNTGTPGNEDALMVVNGNTGDALQLAGTWTAATPTQTGAALSAIYGSGYGFVAGTSYTAYTLQGATVFVANGVGVTNSATASATSTSATITQGVTVESLFGTTPNPDVFTDANTDQSFKGVVVVGGSAGYQWSTDGTNWTTLISDASDAKAVYLSKDTLIRYNGLTAGADRYAPTELVVRLVDTSGATGSSSLSSNGTEINVSNATGFGNGGTTAYSGNTVTLKVDATAPNAPVISVYADDTGTATGDFGTGTTTDDATPTLKGTAEALSTVKLYTSAGTLLGTTTADANGNWTYTPTTPLAEATYNLVATATDAAGNVSALSNSFALTVDVNTAPVATQSSSTSDPFGPALLPNYSSFVDGTSFNKTSYTGDGTYTWGSTDVTVTGNTGTVMSTSEPGSFLIGENVDEKVNFVFDKAVSKVVIDFSTVTFSSTSQEELVVYVNGARYSISASEITNGSNVSIVGGAIRSSSTTSSASGTLTIVSQPGTTGITEISTETNWISGVPNGIIVGVVPFENTSSSEPVVTESFTVQSLFGASYSDSDSDAMKGVLVTAAGDATAQASLGKYQYSTDGGTTWIDVASSLSETNALYLPTTALVRFSPVAGNTLTAKPSFTAHLVDSYSLSPNYTAGQTYDASVNGGSTSISEDTVTLGLSASDVSVSTATSVNEGTASVFTVSLPNNTGGYIDLAYSLSGAATAADYGSAIFSNGVTKNADGTLNVPAGVTSFTVTLPIVADKTTEGAEVLTMTVGVANASTTINDTSNGSNSTPVVQPTFAINGASAWDQSGYSVSNAGDVNGDGLDDIIIGSIGYDDAKPGKAFVVFGQTGTPAGINLSAVAQGNGGFVINGESGRAGFSVSAAGDVNGDGLADVVVGTIGGRSYVVYGTSSTSPINLTAVVSGSGGFVINQPTTSMGNLAVSSAGDVNGDGYADLIIRYQTEAYVQFGSSAPSTINLASWSSGAGGMKLTGINSSSGVSAAGDINGDGLSDVIVGDSAKSSYAGGAYVVYGTTANATTIGLSTMAASQGFAINGQAANNYAGYSVSAAGDVNGDGLADVIVGAYNYNSSVGRSYVVFGTSGAPTSINLTAVAAGSGGYAINGLSGGNDYAGYSVSSAGDINGDGLADLIIGATGNNPNTGNSAEGGRAFVVYGKTGTSMLQLSDVANGSGGFYIFNGQTYTDVLGWSVSSAGDMNGDGYADLIVGATGEATTAGVRAGKTYVIYGGSQYITGTLATGTGTAADELVVGTGSGDTLTGGGGVDRFSGGAGNDTVVLTASDVTNLANTAVGGVKAYVAGGEGYDTVQLSGGTNLNLTTITNAGAVTGATGEQLSRINSIERIDLGTDTAANTLTLTATDVKDMAGFNLIRTGSASADGRTWINVSGTALGMTTPYHQMVVEGDSLDKLSIVTTLGGWVQVGVVSNGTTQYKVLQNEQTRSQLIVDARVQTVIDPNTQPIAPINLTSMAITNGGYDVSYAGDVNGDGIDDMLVSAFSGSIVSDTKSYVVFGTTGNLMPLALTAMTASQGFAINDPTGGMRTVHYAGDLNGDGLSDVILGQPNEGSSSGAAYVVYGKTDGNLVTVGANMGTSGFMIDSTGNTSQFGTEVSTAGDFNGDGIADLVVGASASGNAYILYGSTSGTNITYSGPGSLGTQGLELVNGGAGFGTTVSNIGDINGDGLSDVIVGGNGTINQGMDYVVFGRTASGSLDMATMGTGGLKILGNATSEYANAVAGAGDVNGDGVADLLVGAYGTNKAYVVFGGASLANTTITLSNAGGTTPGFTIVDNLAESFGTNVSYAGDINGDGLADLVVGANTADPTSGTDAGRSYVVYGKTSSTTVYASDLRLGVGGFVINGFSTSNQQGFGVSNGGDLNGDGYDDLLVSSSKAGSTVGSSYVIYGGAQYVSSSIALGSGTSADELVMGSTGNDTLTGAGGLDRFSAAAGDDTVVLAASDVTNLANNTAASVKASLDGGTGYDTVRLSGGANLDLTTITNIDSQGGMDTSRINSVERIDMASDTAANTLTLTARDVNDMASFDLIHLGVSEDGKTWTNVSGTALGTTTPYHQLVVDGDSNDALVLPPGTGSWAIVGKVNNGSTDYWVYQNDATRSQVLVNTAMPTAVNVQPQSVNVTYRGLEDAPAPTSGTLGVRVGDLENLAGSDVNNDSLGIAITGQNNLFTGTTLYYSTNGGSSWNPLTASNYSDTNALLLNADARLYLVGAANTAGTLSRLSVRLWDGTDGGTSGSTKNISGLTGPSGAYSATTSELGWSITNVNDAPTLSVTTLATAATYSGSAVTLFSGASANAGPTNESSQNFVGLRLQAAGLKDGADERLTIDGTTFSLSNGTTATTTNGWTVSVSNSGGASATVTLSKAAGATATDVNTLINGVQYTNTATTKTSGARDFRVSYLQDDGGTANSGVDAVSLNGTYSRVVVPVAPVVLDLDRDGQIEYTQQLMDVNMDGQLDQSAWASREDGVLVWDKFGTGEVKDLSQYAFTAFGGETDLQGLAAGFDSNADGVLDAQDAKFAEFGVWQDADGDGTADAGELRSLADVGIASIDLQSDGVARSPADGVTEAGRTEATLADGSAMLVADAAFTFNTVPVLNLDAVLKDGVADIADGKAELLKINLSDLLQLPTTADGQHVLQVIGDEVDAVELEGLLDGQPGTWSSTSAVTQNGHTYNVYQHSADPSLQVLIDQHIAQSNVHSS